MSAILCPLSNAEEGEGKIGLSSRSSTELLRFLARHKEYPGAQVGSRSEASQNGYIPGQILMGQRF